VQNPDDRVHFMPPFLNSNSPSTVGMLRRSLLLSAFRLMRPPAPISLSLLPLPPSRARRTPTAVLSGASSFLFLSRFRLLRMTAQHVACSSS
jgi:hypothetical protein